MILCIDTALSVCQVGLFNDQTGQLLASVCDEQPHVHTQKLIPMIQSILQENNLTFKNLTGIVVTTGPGSFTGIRVGIATARSLALAANLIVIGFPTLLVFSQEFRKEKNQKHNSLLLPAGRNQFYLYNKQNTEISLITESEGKSLLQSGALIIQEKQISLIVLAELGVEAMKNKTLSQVNIRPVYVRPPDAEKPSRLLTIQQKLDDSYKEMK